MLLAVALRTALASRFGTLCSSLVSQGTSPADGSRVVWNGNHNSGQPD
jgi:hypothetical protein